MPRRKLDIPLPSSRRWLRSAGVVGAVALLAAFTAATRSAAPEVRAPQAAPFYLGADISFLDSPMRPGMAPRTYQENGQPSDELTILQRHGWNAFRLRVFVSPVRQAPDNSLENTIPLARRIKAAGARLPARHPLLRHLGRPAAPGDPGRVAGPGLRLAGEAGRDLQPRDDRGAEGRRRDARLGAGRQRDHPRHAVAAGAAPDPGQQPVPAAAALRLRRAVGPPDAHPQGRHPRRDGGRGRHAAAGSPSTSTGAGTGPTTKWFFDHLEAAHVPYDIIAESFYPEWRHGTLEQLWQNMNELRAALSTRTSWSPRRATAARTSRTTRT